MPQDPGLIDGVSDDIGGVIAVVSDATVQAQLPGQTCTATQDFAFAWKGVTVNFWANETTAVDAALLTALQAQGAPITTP